MVYIINLYVAITKMQDDSWLDEKGLTENTNLIFNITNLICKFLNKIYT